MNKFIKLVTCILIIFLILLFLFFSYNISPKLLSQKQIDELYRLMNVTDKVLTEKKIPYFISCGTLLGSVRNKGFITWDNDIDIGIFEKDLEKIPTLSQEFQPFDIAIKYDDKIWRISSKKLDNIYIDIFPYSEIEKKKYHHTDIFNRHRFSKEFMYEDEIFPIEKKYTFGPLILPGPKDAIIILERMYGKNWKDSIMYRNFFSKIFDKTTGLNPVSFPTKNYMQFTQ